MKRGNAEMRNSGVRKPENVFREIGFDSCEMQEVVCLEESHLRVDVGSEKHAKKSGIRRFRESVQQVRKIVFV